MLGVRQYDPIYDVDSFHGGCVSTTRNTAHGEASFKCGVIPTARIWEFRGSGRERYMVRERDVDSPHDPIYDEAVWTDYQDDLPMVDYTVDDEGVVTEGLSYMLGVAQYDPSDDVSYFHGDQVSTTRHMTDDTGAVARSVVTTAFGEPVHADGTVGTRYAYAGAHGYESFDALDWGTDVAGNAMGFPYRHVGHRWYAPETGRFLERDPIGIMGGTNAYVYTDSQPTRQVDPTGLIGENWPSTPGGILVPPGTPISPVAPVPGPLPPPTLLTPLPSLGQIPNAILKTPLPRLGAYGGACLIAWELGAMGGTAFVNWVVAKYGSSGWDGIFQEFLFDPWYGNEPKPLLDYF